MLALLLTIGALALTGWFVIHFNRGVERRANLRAGLALIFAAMIAPYALMACFILISRRHDHYDTLYDIPAAVGCIAFGLVIILNVPLRWWYRLALGLVYLVYLPWALTIFTLYFVGSAYNRWL
ncbi:MAG: hypothetical protein AB7K24_20560 [Gemmataceae bacterium]